MTYEYKPGTPIDAIDIRAGDLVRRIDRTVDGQVRLAEFTVTCEPGRSSDFDWELIERPKPEFKPGQVWAIHKRARYFAVVEDGDRGGLRGLIMDKPGLCRVGYLEKYRDQLTYVGELETTVKPFPSVQAARDFMAEHPSGAETVK